MPPGNNDKDDNPADTGVVVFFIIFVNGPGTASSPGQNTFPSIYIFHMKLQLPLISALAALSLLGACSKPQTRIQYTLPDKFEGMEVSMVNYADSTVLASDTVRDGKVSFSLDPDKTDLPVLVQIMVDGRIRAYYIAEPGEASLDDSISVAAGTPLNDRLGQLMARLDSVEALDDIQAYSDFTGRIYNENKDNPIGLYFGTEWLRFASDTQADSIMAAAGPLLAGSLKARQFVNFAHLRAKTAPGREYVDVTGEDAAGAPVDLSSMIKPGHYTVIDFWASWCPYCIKEVPALKDLLRDYGAKGLDIVGVAVRDKTEDTAAAIERHGIDWPVLYNTQRRPYDLYGFTGIPHTVLVGPDGTIISRGENAEALRRRVASLLD